MKVRWGRVAWCCAGLGVLIGAAGLIAPELDAERMRQPLATALEQTLGRKVEFREVRYQVFPKPGLSATDLVIPEDPEFGLEPFAYVGEMQAGISFSSLFTGHLSISSVRLVEASVNLARKEDTGWNVAKLLDRMATDVKRGGVPHVEMRESRVNFRNGTMKSAFFLNAVDVDLEPPDRSNGSLSWSYEASPARTDRAEQGFGRFTGRGRWRPSATGEGRMEVDLVLQRSVISELMTLVTGRDLGVQGRFSSRAFLDGPMNQLKVRGSVEFENIERPGFFGLRGQKWALGYEGVIDLTGQHLTLFSVKPKDGEALPLALRLECSRLLADPQWVAGFTVDNVPAPALLDLGRKLGVAAPESLKVEGTVSGSIAYSQSEPLSGQMSLKSGKLSLEQAGPLTMEQAGITIAGTEVVLAQVAALSASGAEVRVGGRWRIDSQELDFELESGKLPLAELQAAVASMKGVPPLPVLDACREGQIKGNLRFDRGPSGEAQQARWSGQALAAGVECLIEGAPSPLKVETAQLVWKGASCSIRKLAGELGDWKLAGEAAYNAATRRPWQWNIAVESATGESIDRLLQGGLPVRRSLMDRTLRRRPVLPAWVRSRQSEGRLKFGTLALGEETLRGVSAHLFWDGAVIEVPELSGRWNDSSVTSHLRIRLGDEGLLYQALGRVDGLDWKGGQVDAEFDVTTPVLAGPFPGSLRASGQVFGRNAEVGGDTVRQFQACWEYDGVKPASRLKLGCLEAQVGGEWLYGHSTPAADGRLAVELSGPKHTLKTDLGGDPSRTR